MRALWLIALLSPALTAVASPRLQVEIGSLEGPGIKARAIEATLDADGMTQLAAVAVQVGAVPFALDRLSLRCAQWRSRDGWECADLRASAQSAQAGAVEMRGALRLHAAWQWTLILDQAQASALTFSEPTGRYATDHLRVEARARVDGSGDGLAADVHLDLRQGQSYVEPVFIDYGPHAAHIDAALQLDWRRHALAVSSLRARQDGVVDAQATLAIADWTHLRDSLALTLDLRGFDLGAGLPVYVAPFFAGSRFEGIAGGGAADAHVVVAAGQPVELSLTAHDLTLQLPKLDLALDGVEGAAAWSAAAVAPDSRLRWTAARFGKLDLGGSALAFTTHGRDLRLLEPWWMPVLDGGLRVSRLDVRDAGLPQMGAAFEARIEPISLAPLCAALGWPQFGGQLSGSIPGLTLRDRTLSLDGALKAQAFDGSIVVDHLRVIDPLGVLPRVTADVAARNIDLSAVTGAFSFGRIDGRLDGDITGLKLIGWQPVAMNARLQTPSHDASRHRISQRAIDNISSLGGGPSGVLSRGFLRFFKDFAYDRIGWSCVLADSVCHMDGLEPAADGRGYVLVKGKLLPRIDVVGYTREVAWSRFLAQLIAARESGAVEVRRP